MTNYRIVARHVRYWRGAIHKWSNVFPFSGTIASGSYPTAIDAIHTMLNSICYPAPGGGGGGVWEIAMYNQSSGGVPVSVASYFDPSNTASWIGYDGGAWGSLSSELDSVAETALQVEWLAGLSSSGKPVSFKKWFHAVPVNTSPPPTPDVSTGRVTSLTSAIETGMTTVGGLGAPLGNGSRLAATTPIIKTFYGNHQMPRGRRRAPLVTASGRYRGPSVEVPPPVEVA